MGYKGSQGREERTVGEKTDIVQTLTEFLSAAGQDVGVKNGIL